MLLSFEKFFKRSKRGYTGFVSLAKTSKINEKKLTEIKVPAVNLQCPNRYIDNENFIKNTL